MRYIVSGEFTKIDETSGTIQNTSKINVVEVSDTNEKGSGIMLYPLDRFTFSKSIYARCVDGGGAEVRVVPFEAGVQRGGGSSTVVTVPGGGGSGIAFAGMILGTESSTVDGGLWYEVDELLAVKIFHNGSTFALDTKPAGDTLIGNKLYLSGHEFKLTGFAGDLTFSENNFYSGDTAVGNVSDYQFVFTDAAALSVADGDSIAITQLDTDAVNFSLDLDSLNTATPAQWSFEHLVNPGDATTNSEYHYKSSVGANYLRQDSASYTKASGNQTSQELVLNLAEGLKSTELTLRNFRLKKKSYAADTFAPSKGATPYVTVEEIYTNGTLTKFVVTINSDAAVTENNTNIDTITATAPEDVEVEFKFADSMYYRYSEHSEGSLTRDNKGVYTFATDTYKEGYDAAVTSGNVTTLTKTTFAETPTYFIWGDKCTISGLAQGLSVQRIAAYTYNIYKGATLVGTIDNRGTINITDASAFNISDEVKNGTATTVIATVNDTEAAQFSTDTDFHYSALAYQITLDNSLKQVQGVTYEGFTYDSHAYYYHTGKFGWRLVENSVFYDNEGTTSTQTISCVPPKTIQTINDTSFSMKISGVPYIGELVILGLQIYKATDVTTATTDGVTTTTVNAGATEVGRFSTTLKHIDFGTGGGFGGRSYYTLADAGYPTITLSGNNDYVLYANNAYKTDVSCYVNSNAIDFCVDTYYIGYTRSEDGKTATYHSEDISKKRIYLTPPTGYTDRANIYSGRNATALYWRLTENGDDSTDILFCEFNGQDFVLNSHAFDNMSISSPIYITDTVRSTPINFSFDLATDADTAAISRTFANETFTAGATAGTYTYSATGSTAGWNVSADGSKIASWELNGKTFTLENLRTDLGNLGFDSQGYIHATNGSTIGRMGGNVIKLYNTAVHKLATPILTGTDAADFTLILPS